MNSATSARAIFVPCGRAYPGPVRHECLPSPSTSLAGAHDGPLETALAHRHLHLAQVGEGALRRRRSEAVGRRTPPGRRRARSRDRRSTGRPGAVTPASRMARTHVAHALRGARRAFAPTGRLDGVQHGVLAGHRGGHGDAVEQVAGRRSHAGSRRAATAWPRRSHVTAPATEQATHAVRRLRTRPRSWRQSTPQATGADRRHRPAG